MSNVAPGGVSKRTALLRTPVIFVLCIFFAAPAWSDELPSMDALISTLSGADYQLGGAATRSARLPEQRAAVPPSATQPRLRLSVPRLIRETGETIQRTAFGGLRIYFGEGWDDGQDVFQLGTALTRGQTTAGVSVTYEDGTQEMTSSELYIDYAVTERFSVGVSGIFNEDVTQDSAPVPQLGLSAELTSPNGSFFQGGIADTADNTPIFGLAIGLRF